MQNYLLTVHRAAVHLQIQLLRLHPQLLLVQDRPTAEQHLLVILTKYELAEELLDIQEHLHHQLISLQQMQIPCC